jgi:RalA-binding protein 1
MSTSTSAVGLGLRADVPLMARNNSDRDTYLQYSGTSAPPSPADPHPGLLPSPMTASESKRRRESRVMLPPDLDSLMAQADSGPTIPASTSSNTLSPTSQYSASPSVIGRDESLIIHSSSRALAVTAEVDNEEEEEVQRRKSDEVVHDSRDLVDSASGDIRASLDSNRPAPGTPGVSTDRRGAPRLSGALLPHTRLAIPSSSVYPNSVGRDVLCFIITITIRPPNAQPITWNVAKLFSAFIDLDTKIKAKSGKARKEWKQMVLPLPEGRAWKDFAPSKIDQRKATLELYLQSLLTAPLSDKSDLCEFLSTDQVRERLLQGRKEGYLTKKGKNFGG